VQLDDHVPENPGTAHEYSSTQEKIGYPPGPPPRVVPEYPIPNTKHGSSLASGIGAIDLSNMRMLKLSAKSRVPPERRALDSNLSS
jgi:hypothetical protein